jgi:hypothetical protein
MKFFFSFLIFFLNTFFLFSQDSVAYRIVLIGDGGELTNGRHPVAEAVKKMIPLDARTTIIYLGDNLYKHGLPDDQTLGYNEAKAVLDSQLSIADGTPATIYMIPGNHDWNNGSRNGYDAILREQIYVDALNKKNVIFQPKDGCPGPVEVSLGPDVTVVLFDSQWWLQPFDKPGIESDCPYKTKEEVLTQLDDIFSRNSKKLVLLAGHHTFKSKSPHAGYFTLKQHVFPFTDIFPQLYIPLPIIGSIYPITRGVFGTPQDLRHPNYENMISQIQSVAKSYRNIIFTGGHEHSLQLIKDSSYNYIVSGTGTKTSRVYKGKQSLFATETTGFCVLEVSKNRNVRANFYTVTDSIRQVYSDNILNFLTIDKPVDSASTVNRQVENSTAIKFDDTITISASNSYITHSSLKKFVMGNNYRQEWATPVNMKVFNLNQEKGGLKISSLGGGKQTKSLKLSDATGKEWVLRTVDKDPARAIPENFRPTAAADIVKDFISASHPYGAMAVPTLANALALTVAKPELFFVPDDPAFGIYKNIFKNTICFLEEGKPTPHGEETNSTIKVFNKLIEENDHRADQLAVLRARLLDILLADFDRHFDQWRWATGDTGKGKLYYPIPKDRDQAFFYSDGILMKFVSSKTLRFLKGFRSTIPDVNGLGEVARDFDRVFLTDLDDKEWKTTIKEVQDKLNDTVINVAIKKLPPEIYAIDGEVLTKKLISRRNLIEKAGMTYYRFISKRVNIVGSNEKEYFKLTSVPDGLNVKVYARNEKNDTNFVMYDRTFDHRVTREIRLYGLNDNDLFDIGENVSSRIKVRVIGGKGNDTFDIRGNVHNYLYDLDVEGNYIKNKSHSHNLFSKDAPVNSYNIVGFKYNQTNFPSFVLAANNDDGLLIGTGFSRKAYGFRNDPYVSYQRFAALYAINRGGRQLKYSGIFNHALRNTDIVLTSELMFPGISNFFGLGNNTILDKSKSISYYRARYGHMETQLLFQKRVFETLKVMAGPVVYMYWNKPKDNIDKVLGTPTLIGLDSPGIYRNKSYAGGKLAIDINNLNNELFPTRGIKWNTELVSMAGVSKTSNSITKLQSDMTIYASLNDPTRLVAVLQLGAGRIFNKNFEYFQAMTLGSHNYLRGFRKNRFAGRSIAYGGLELRWKLGNIKSYILPGAIGLIGFTEAGRVWLEGESSHRWHNAYGGGFYFIPFNLFLVSATMGFSREEHLLNFSVGTKLNLSF